MDNYHDNAIRKRSERYICYKLFFPEFSRLFSFKIILESFYTIIYQAMTLINWQVARCTDVIDGSKILELHN